MELVKPARVIGKNTVECLQSGVIYGFAGQIDGVVARMIEELGEVTAVIATGGLAPVVIDECRTITHHEPMITLIGLAGYERNERRDGRRPVTAERFTHFLKARKTLVVSLRWNSSRPRSSGSVVHSCAT